MLILSVHRTVTIRLWLLVSVLDNLLRAYAPRPQRKPMALPKPIYSKDRTCRIEIRLTPEERGFFEEQAKEANPDGERVHSAPG